MNRDSEMGQRSAAEKLMKLGGSSTPWVHESGRVGTLLVIATRSFVDMNILTRRFRGDGSLSSNGPSGGSCTLPSHRGHTPSDCELAAAPPISLPTFDREVILRMRNFGSRAAYTKRERNNEELQRRSDTNAERGAKTAAEWNVAEPNEKPAPRATRWVQRS